MWKWRKAIRNIHRQVASVSLEYVRFLTKLNATNEVSDMWSRKQKAKLYSSFCSSWLLLLN